MGWGWGFGGDAGGSDAFGIGQSAAGPFVGAYDAIVNLVHVYEPARCTLSAYTGQPLVRLRRASDDAESDFSHVSASAPELDLAAIAAWAGGASYYAKVYDQLGDDDLVQATAGKQPLFSANVQNSHAGAVLDGSNHAMEATWTTGGALAQPLSIYIAAALDATAVNDNVRRYLFCDDNSEDTYARQREDQTPNIFGVKAGGAFLNGNPTNVNWLLWSILLNGASSQFWHNTVSQASGNAGANGMSGVTIGAYHTEISEYWKGTWSGWVVASAAHSAAQRGAMETAMNAYWAAY